jgi:sugar phosphate isomerase/epimerase
MGRLFYNTNGFPHHRLEDVVTILADLGYDGVALTPDVHHLDPMDVSEAEVEGFLGACRDRDLDVILETGARFVLDPRRKHRPSLLDDDPAPRVDFLRRVIELAALLEAPVVSVWSGSGPEGLGFDDALDRLAATLPGLLDHAADRGIRIGFEPEPGMAVETTAQWEAVRDRIAHEALGLTLDVGHCVATREGEPDALIKAYAADLLVIQLDDHRRGVHEHLALGEGEVDFTAVGEAVLEVGFEGPLEVELSRHGATAPATAAAALAFLRRVFGPVLEPHPPADASSS